MSQGLALPVRSLPLVSAKNGNPNQRRRNTPYAGSQIALLIRLIGLVRKTAILSDSTARSWLTENASPATLMRIRPV